MVRNLDGAVFGTTLSRRQALTAGLVAMAAPVGLAACGGPAAAVIAEGELSPLLTELFTTASSAYVSEIAAKLADATPAVLRAALGVLTSEVTRFSPPKYWFFVPTMPALQLQGLIHAVSGTGSEIRSHVVQQPSGRPAVCVPGIVQLALNYLTLRQLLWTGDPPSVPPAVRHHPAAVAGLLQSNTVKYPPKRLAGSEDVRKASKWTVETYSNEHVDIQWNPSKDADLDCVLQVRKGAKPVVGPSPRPVTARFIIPYHRIFDDAQA